MNLKIIISLFFIIISCSEKVSENNYSKSSEVFTQDLDEYLSLNNNNKWEMDTHTRASIGKMVTISKNILLSSKDIGNEIQNELNVLFNGCTMQGDAHNELHKFLQLFIPIVHQLKETGEVTELDKIKNQLEIYQKYFK